MKFITFSPIHFEKWDWRNSVQKGIGGSETSTCENAWRLAKRGHEVINYAPIPDDCPGVWRDTKWLPLDKFNTDEPGVYIIYRSPSHLDMFDKSRKDQAVWFLAQDWLYDFTPNQLAVMDRFIVLCRAHERHVLREHPHMRPKIWCSQNGIKVDLIEEIEAEGPIARNPRRIMYASSPDRGLLSALKIFKRAKESVPDLEFYASYGYDNLNKMLANPGMEKYARDKEQCLRLVEETGAKFLGRIPQHQLYREWFKTGMSVYCTDFFETSWISGAEMSAMGAIPVFSPVYAQRENTKHGVAIVGDPKDDGTIARFAAEVVNLAKNPDLQEAIRKDMMPETRARRDWEVLVTGWERAAAHDLGLSVKKYITVKTEADFVRLADAGVDMRFPDGEDKPPRQKDRFTNIAYQHPAAETCGKPIEAEARNKWGVLKPGDIVFDIGAAHGDWSMPLAAMGATVYAFEPTFSAEYIARLAFENGFQDRLHVLRCCVGKEHGTKLTIKAPPDLSGDRAMPANGWTVACISLDKFTQPSKLNGPNWVDYIKIDVEGKELDVLIGASELLKRCRPTLMVEVHCGGSAKNTVKPEQVADYLQSLGVGYEVSWDTQEDGWYAHLHAKAAERPIRPESISAPKPTVAVEWVNPSSPILADNADEVVSRSLWLHMQPGQLMIDVGSCDGSWAVPAAMQGASVVAIDQAMPHTRLHQLATAVNLVDKITLVEAWVGDQSAGDFITLDSLALEAGYTHVDFIKIDVEGQELAVLRGAQALIRRFKPKLMVEVHEEVVAGVSVTPAEVETLLADLEVGYKFTRRKLYYQGKVYWHLYAETT